MRFKTLIKYRIIFRKCLPLLFILILSFISTVSYAQVVNITELKREASGIRIGIISSAESFIKSIGNQNHFELNYYIDESSPGKPILPTRVFILAIPPNSEVAVDLLNRVEKTFENVQIKSNPKATLNTDSSFSYTETEISYEYLQENVFPSNEFEVLDYFWLRDYYCAAIQFNPMQFSWKRKSLTSIQSCDINIRFVDVRPYEINTSPTGEFDKGLEDIILNYSSAQSFRSKNFDSLRQDSTGNWIDYSKTYYKLAVAKDGIFRITHNDLISYGIDPSTINPKTIKIFRKGKQVPLFIYGEDDFSFNLNDYIQFWCERNYGSSNYQDIVPQGQDYINYMDRYSDTTMIWLTFGGEDGKRLSIIPNSTSITADTIKSSLTKLHLEQDIRLWYHSANDARTQLPFWQEHKVFTWLTIGNSGSQNIIFNASDFTLNTPIKTTTRLISNSGDVVLNGHKNGSSLNSTTVQDTIIFNYLKTVNFESYFNSNQLIEGNNTYTVFGLPSAASFHRSLIDWVEIEYYRQNKSINDSLTIIIPDSVLYDFRNIRVSNLSTPDSLLIIYKVGSDSKIITGFNYVGGVLVFSDSVRGGDKYIISKQGYSLSPSFRYSRGFKNLRDLSRGADYVMITHSSLAQSTQEYEQFINSNYNTRVERIFIEDIYDEFSYGQNWAEAIRYFLIYAKDNWVSPAPSYLNLIGDANYDYKDIWNPAPSPRKKNLVPSYGFPVSDIWFTTWDSSNLNIPQMYVGRIPANQDSEVRNYLRKHQSYLERRYDDWNKKYILFSGGDPTKISELNLIKSANDHLLNNYLAASPIGGRAIHFYKTINPQTNFGPYTVPEINNAVDSSGIFISYIGHSGTRTWDNGITEVEDILNKFQNRYPLISDFGCSTGKFAEPDVNAFGELFVAQSSNGQAIGYLGNSSLGYFSTSLRFPEIFYKKILLDSILTLSKAHVLAKVEQLNLTGYNDVNRAFNFCNIIFADPLLKFSLPEKPNFVVNSGSIIIPSQVSDQDDSIAVKIKINNWGKVVADSLVCIVSNIYNGQINFIDTVKIKCPEFSTLIDVYIKTRNLVGTHKLTVQVDPNNQIDEVYEDDNNFSLDYSVYSSSIRPVEIEKHYAAKLDSILFLNPIFSDPNLQSNFIVSLSNNPDFINSTEYLVSFDTLVSSVSFNNLIPDSRYWYRSRLNTTGVEWSSGFSFKNIENNYEWFIDKDHNELDIAKFNTEFDSTDLSWKLSKVLNNLKITSAGSNDGKFASMIFNNQEKLPNTFFWGIASAEIDTITYEPYNIKYYAWPNSISQNSDSLINYINLLPTGKMIALAICDDAAQTVLGFGGGTAVRRAIETLGSYYIDSVRYRESWCILGIKGAPAGSVPESYQKLFQGFATIDTTKLTAYENGTINFPVVGNSSSWQDIVLIDSIPNGANLEIIPLGIRMDGQIDTLESLIFNVDSASMSYINSSIYPNIRLLAKLDANDVNESPTIKSIGINFIPPPELAINFQVVSVSKDTLLEGDFVTLKFYVYNVGESSADSFIVKVDILNEDNSRETIMNELVPSLSSESHRLFEFNYTAQKGDRQKSFLIEIDPTQTVREYYEDNNFFSKQFFVKADSLSPTLKIKFDNNEILDGDFVSNKPEIIIEIFDESPLLFTDTSSVKIFLNEDPIHYADNPINLTYQFNNVNPKFVGTYKPELEDGDYLLRVAAKDPSGNNADSISGLKYFIVNSAPLLLNVYNYPNPFTDETYFTFRLTQIPDEVRIKIYTIAGRLIKEIIKLPSELNFDFNKIFWDGKDADGDEIANGTYLYKIIMKSGDKTQTETQKLVRVK